LHRPEVVMATGQSSISETSWAVNNAQVKLQVKKLLTTAAGKHHWPNQVYRYLISEEGNKRGANDMQ